MSDLPGSFNNYSFDKNFVPLCKVILFVMQVTIEIKGDKAFSILEVLKSMKGVKVKSVDQSKEEYLRELSKAYNETELAEQGKIKLKSFDELINEL